MQWSDKNGVWRDAPDVDDVIGRALPKDLHPYFFFDGERIEQIASSRVKMNTLILASATKMLLGLEMLDTRDKHTSTMPERLLRRSFDGVGDTESQNLLNQKRTERRGIFRKC